MFHHSICVNVCFVHQVCYYYPVSSIMQPVHVSTQPHSSERKNTRKKMGENRNKTL